MLKFGGGYVHLVSGEIRCKEKWCTRLYELRDETEFNKACRGYAIAVFQKHKWAYDHEMVDMVCDDVRAIFELSWSWDDLVKEVENADANDL